MMSEETEQEAIMLSYTSMQRWLRCGRAQYLHILGVPTPLSASLASGIIFHAALKAWADGRDDPEFVPRACAMLERGEAPNELRLDGWNGQLKGELDPALIGHVLEEYTAKHRRPATSEVYFERTVYLPDPVRLYGYVDALSHEGTIIDYKLVQSHTYRPDTNQLLFYALGLNLPIDAGHAFHICRPNQPVSYIVLNATHEQCAFLLYNQVAEVAKAISNACFPARTEYCSWCEFREHCKGRVTVWP